MSDAPGGGWAPSGSRNKAVIKRHWRERQAREFLLAQSPERLKALKKMMTELDDMPDGATVEIWDDLKHSGLDLLVDILDDKVMGRKT